MSAGRRFMLALCHCLPLEALLSEFACCCWRALIGRSPLVSPFAWGLSANTNAIAMLLLLLLMVMMIHGLHSHANCNDASNVSAKRVNIETHKPAILWNN